MLYAKQMGQISFQDEPINRRSLNKSGGGLADKLVAWGLAKNRQSAEKILFLAAVIGIVIAAVMLIDIARPPILPDIPTKP